jgi:hypothetical protein
MEDFERGKQEKRNTVVAWLDGSAYHLTPYNGLLFIDGIDTSKGKAPQRVFGVIPVQRLVALAQRWIAESKGIDGDRRIKVTPEMVKTVRESNCQTSRSKRIDSPTNSLRTRPIRVARARRLAFPAGGPLDKMLVYRLARGPPHDLRSGKLVFRAEAVERTEFAAG